MQKTLNSKKKKLIMDRILYLLLNYIFSTELRYQIHNGKSYTVFDTFFANFIVGTCFKYEKNSFEKSNSRVSDLLCCPSLMSSPELYSGEDINLGPSPV